MSWQRAAFACMCWRCTFLGPALHARAGCAQACHRRLRCAAARATIPIPAAAMPASHAAGACALAPCPSTRRSLQRRRVCDASVVSWRARIAAVGRRRGVGERCPGTRVQGARVLCCVVQQAVQSCSSPSTPTHAWCRRAMQSCTAAHQRAASARATTTLAPPLRQQWRPRPLHSIFSQVLLESAQNARVVCGAAASLGQRRACLDCSHGLTQRFTL